MGNTCVGNTEPTFPRMGYDKIYDWGTPYYIYLGQLYRWKFKSCGQGRFKCAPLSEYYIV